MVIRSFLHLLKLLGGVAIFLAATVHDGMAATLEQEVANRLDQLRAVRSEGGPGAIEAYNKQMDEIWRFFTANKPLVLPMLRRQLKAELGREKPSDLVLLDIGFFIHENDNAEGKALGLDALFRLNPYAPVVVANDKELFEFAYAASKEHDGRVLDLIGNAFLSSDQKIFIPQHALMLDGTLACVFLYGAYGPESEGALRKKLKDKSMAKRALEVLVWLGSPAALQDASDALAAAPNYETFARVTSYMMQSAGPAGRNFMLTLAPDKLDDKSRQYLSNVSPRIREMSFEAIRASFKNFPGDKKLPDAVVAARLAAMIKNFGKDEDTNPLAILDSGLGSEFLINELAKVRSRALYRLSDEALDDVRITDALMNGLRYRGK